MSAKKKTTSLVEPMIYSNFSALEKSLLEWFGKRFEQAEACFICVKNNETAVTEFAMKSLDKGAPIKRVLIVFLGRPIDLVAMGKWRKWAVVHHDAYELRMDFVSEEPTQKELEDTISQNCENWFKPQPEPEEVAIERGKWVAMPDGKAKDSPSLLTMMFGSMGELLTEVDVVARRFRGAMSGVKPDDRQTYLKAVDSRLADPAKSDWKKPGQSAPEFGSGKNVTDQLPKLLLRGESGVGKTLIAGYLHERCGLVGRPLHISIPEYLGKEDMFEYTLFGYAAGNYTGGRKDGDHGLLLENVGEVVFLDEIGEANAAIQAKLLTFLDHYCVRPRGWLGKPFYCPVLIVAATNRDLDETVAGKPVFRRDLLARFTDCHPIPPLRERKQDFEFILDCLLQRESMNPEGVIKHIGADALEYLKARKFTDGNFRELEDSFRYACKKALRESRSYLVQPDFA